MSKNWFITGASSGFGHILTERLLEGGDRVFATIRKAGPLDELQTRYGEQLIVEKLDVTDTAAVKRVLADAFARLKRVDVIVNNAAYGLFGAGEEVSDEQIRRQIDTNLIGSIQVIRSALPHLRAQGGGRILQVSSEGGQIAYPNFSLYHSTKWGIEGFVESVAQEVRSFGIEFTIVEPGPSRTGFGAKMDRAPAMAAYENTPSGEMRRAFAQGTFVVKGDAMKFVQAMIDSVNSSPAPKRLTLGSAAYYNIRDALLERVAELELQKGVALSADVDA